MFFAAIIQITSSGVITIEIRNVNTPVTLDVFRIPGNIVENDFASLMWTNNSGLPLILSALPSLYDLSFTFGAAESCSALWNTLRHRILCFTILTRWRYP